MGKLRRRLLYSIIYIRKEEIGNLKEEEGFFPGKDSGKKQDCLNEILKKTLQGGML